MEQGPAQGRERGSYSPTRLAYIGAGVLTLAGLAVWGASKLFSGSNEDPNAKPLSESAPSYTRKAEPERQLNPNVMRALRPYVPADSKAMFEIESLMCAIERKHGYCDAKLLTDCLALSGIEQDLEGTLTQNNPQITVEQVRRAEARLNGDFYDRNASFMSPRRGSYVSRVLLQKYGITTPELKEPETKQYN